MVQFSVYAKPGELIQGMLPGNQSFMVSNMSSLYFKNTTTLSLKTIADDHDYKPLPEKCTKAADLFYLIPAIRSRTISGNQLNITQQTNIPIGKGLSSSSTDVLGILAALCNFYNHPLAKDEIYRLACTIEPTDPCLDSGNVVFDQRSGEILKILPHLPYKILYFDSDPDKEIDTLAMQKCMKYSIRQQYFYKEILELISCAFENQDYNLFYDCLRRSARENEIYLPKKRFSLLIDFAQQINCGIFIAHTGTYMGLVFKKETQEVLEAKRFIENNWNSKTYFE